MDKYKVLLIGRNKMLIGDFFSYLEEDFEMQTSSMRHADIISHIRYFRPHVLVYCMNKEEKERTEIAASVKSGVTEHDVAVVLTGDETECEQFKHMSGMGDMILRKPITARTIKNRIVDYMVDKEAREAEAIEREKRAELLIHPEREALAEAVEPVIMKPAPMEATVEPVIIQPAQTETAVEETPKKHVLVVDDDPMLLKLIKEHLKENYAVATAINGAVALKFLENKKTDLILLDYEMPNMNGADVLEQIRSTPDVAHLPVVFLTGVKDREKIKRLVELKPQGYLLKPIDREKLLRCIKSVIG